jgi:hypothetical protein
MLIQKLNACDEFIAGDGTQLRELLHPDKQAVGFALQFSPRRFASGTNFCPALPDNFGSLLHPQRRWKNAHRRRKSIRGSRRYSLHPPKRQAVYLQLWHRAANIYLYRRSRVAKGRRDNFPLIF